MARGKYENRNKRRRRKNNGWIGVLLALVIFALVFMLVLHSCSEQVPDPTNANTTPTQTTPPTTTEEPTTAPTTEPTTVPTEPFVVSTASIGVSGDMLIHSPIFKAAYRSGGVYDFSDLFVYISEYYEKYDFMVANLEVPLAGADKGYSGYPNFNCPDGIAASLKDAGIDMLLTANNHTVDQGHDGLIRTQEVLAEAGLQYLGTRLTEEIPEYIVQDINGIQVGMVCYTYETGDTSDGRKTLNGIPVPASDTNLVSSFHPQQLDEFYADVENVLNEMYAAGAEATVVFIHWGEEYQLKQNQTQETIAQNLCELGVDVIVGGHPHVIQPFTTLTSSTGHETYCIYSVGNAISNQNRNSLTSVGNAQYTEDGMIFGVTFEKWNDGSVNICEIDILPTWVSLDWRNDKGRNYYNIIPLDINMDTWGNFDIYKTSYTYGSYERTMSIVGEGLNACREAMNLMTVPLVKEAQ